MHRNYHGQGYDPSYAAISKALHNMDRKACAMTKLPLSCKESQGSQGVRRDKAPRAPSYTAQTRVPPVTNTRGVAPKS